MESFNFNKIAKDYHLKRKKPWRPLEFFLNFLGKKKNEFHGISLDLGCANGRNFRILGTHPKKIVGIDISLELLKIALGDLNNSNLYSKQESRLIQILLADIRYLPIRNHSIHNVFSIATIHHIKHKADRKELVSQINNILKKNGNIIITVWRKWQKKYRSYFVIDGFRRKVSLEHREQQKIVGLEEHGDRFIPWTLSGENRVYNRFYHFFSKNEIKRLLKVFEIKEFKIMGGPSNNDNFFIFAKKKEF
ncbi:MAG: class I SAM-dependent methyltransferase [Promethearchaeota archaeon]|jgi:SAM-dependent methyltransferase